mgnify:CR=1 FL=1
MSKILIIPRSVSGFDTVGLGPLYAHLHAKVLAKKRAAKIQRARDGLAGSLRAGRAEARVAKEASDKFSQYELGARHD